MPQDTEKIIREIYEKALDRDIDQLLKTGDDDFSFATSWIVKISCQCI